MSTHNNDWSEAEPQLVEVIAAKTVLDQMLDEARLFKSGKRYRALLDFIVRFPSFAPFNAMLLQIQKPGLSYAASVQDWATQFGRNIREGARPLLILRPFGPVALVFDVLDTEGLPLPEGFLQFEAHGIVAQESIQDFGRILLRKNIEILWVDQGDNRAGLIRIVERPKEQNGITKYRMHINRNHPAAVQFATLAHELGHLMLGHLGSDKNLRIGGRSIDSHAQRELEAESVAYLVCGRYGVDSLSHRYLSDFVSGVSTVNELAVYQIVRAAGDIETLLGLAAKRAKGSDLDVAGDF